MLFCSVWTWASFRKLWGPKTEKVSYFFDCPWATHSGVVTHWKTYNTENSKQIFPEKELRGLSPNSYSALLSVSCELVLNLVLAPSWVPIMGHLLKLKCAHSPLTFRILSLRPIYTHDGASAKFSISWDETDYSVWAIYIFPRSVCLFCCWKIGGPTVGINRSLTEAWIWKLGLRPRNSFSGNTWIEISLQCTLRIYKPVWWRILMARQFVCHPPPEGV